MTWYESALIYLDSVTSVITKLHERLSVVEASAPGNLNTRVAALEAKVVSLEARVTELENGTSIVGAKFDVAKFDVDQFG